MQPNHQFEFEFLLFEGFSNLVLSSAMEPLRDVKLRSISGGANWTTSTIDGNPVKSSSGLKISPDRAFSVDCSRRWLVLVAGYNVRRWVNAELSAKLRQAVRGAQLVIALDAAPWLLASAGLLDGRMATLHWQEMDAFEEAFPKVTLSTDRFVRSGPFLTCGGASTALDMMLDLIRELFGAAAAFEASTMFIYDPERQNELKRSTERLRFKGSQVLLDALNVMAENLEDPLSARDLAARVSTSERTLNRAFAQELQITPGKYYQMFRLKRARYLAMETELTLEQIALRCGFSSASSLSRSFRKEFGSHLRQLPKITH